MIGARILALDYAVGERIETNEELVEQFGTWTPDKIYKKTGIKSRPRTDLTTSQFATKAAENLFAHNPHIDRSTVDMIILCTETPDYTLPATACLVHRNLGLRHDAGAFDYSLGCSGYCYGLALAKGFITSAIAKRVLLVTADLVTRYIHPKDKATRPIFGDGASATLLEACEQDHLLAFDFGTDGNGWDHLIIPAGQMAQPCSEETKIETVNRFGNVWTPEHLKMNGREVLNFAIQREPEALSRLLHRAQKTWDQMDLVVFHQASLLLLEQLRDLFHIPDHRFVIDLEELGNTAASTIPIALARAEQSGRLKPGMTLMLSGFGVGLSWSSAILVR